MMTKCESNTSNNVPLPYNSYNIFYILERERVIHERNGKQQVREISGTDFNWYGPLDLPPLPPRYHHLESALAHNWYIPGARKLAKRKHVKSHGVASFREISRIVADNWKNLEPTTQHYVQAVASILKERHAFITSELKHQGTGWCENGPNKRHTQSPIVWRAIEQHQEQRQPTPSPVPIDWPNMMGLLPENNAPQVPYCGVCDYSSNLLEPIAFMPTIPTQVPIQANYVSQESLRLQDDVQLYLQIAANITQHDVLPSECYHSNFQPVFCGDCTDA